MCERDAGINAPKGRYVDIFCIYEPISNIQLALMWRQLLNVLPFWFLAPAIRLNRLMPGWERHEVGNNTQNDRDVHNLLDRFPAHLKFSKEEESKGHEMMAGMGLPIDARIVCMIVRDDAYLESHVSGNWSGHDFRDSDIKNYVLTAEKLANRGFFVVRMGAKVRKPIPTTNPRVIDYATNGMRSDFMDIYLGEKCEFCISTGTGWDAVPGWLFRKPVVFVNYSVVGLIASYSSRFLTVCKHYRHKQLLRNLTLRETFEIGAGFCLSGTALTEKNVELVDNSPDEILAATLEMVDRIDGNWIPHQEDAANRERFLNIFPINAVDPYKSRKVHGEFRALIGAAFLRENRDWLQ